MKAGFPRWQLAAVGQRVSAARHALQLTVKAAASLTHLVHKLFHSGLEPPDLELHGHQLVGTHDGLMTVSPAFP